MSDLAAWARTRRDEMIEWGDTSMRMHGAVARSDELHLRVLGALQLERAFSRLAHLVAEYCAEFAAADPSTVRRWASTPEDE